MDFVLELLALFHDRIHLGFEETIGSADGVSSGCLNKISAPISGASAGFRLPTGICGRS